MRKVLVLAAVTVAAVAVAGIAIAGKPGTNDKKFDYAIGLWGDLPYSAVQADPGVPNLIADMNSQDLEFTRPRRRPEGRQRPDREPAERQLRRRAVHPGARLVQLARTRRRCSRPATTTGPTATGPRTAGSTRSSGSTTSAASSSARRTRSASSDEAGGAVDAALPRRAAGTDRACVENRRWTVKDVTYATVNIQGSCNNLCDTAPEPAEYAARNAADIAWLQQTFAEANAEGSAAVMLISQADPGFDAQRRDARAAARPEDARRDRRQPGPLDGFQSSSSSCAHEAIAFRKPVVLRPRRLALLPHRQAAPGRAGPAPRELHARRDVRRQRRPTASTTCTG